MKWSSDVIEDTYELFWNIIQRISDEYLELRRVTAKFVPRLLTWITRMLKRRLGLM